MGKPAGRDIRFPVVGGVIGLIVALAAAGSAHAAATPGWAIRAVGMPSNFSTADNASCLSHERCDSYVLTATNVGGASTNGETVVFREALPAHIVVEETVSRQERHARLPGEAGEPEMPVTCSGEERGATEVVCEYSGVVKPGGILTLSVDVTLEPGVASSVVDYAEVEGGGAPRAVTTEPTTMPNTVNGAVPSFGLHAFGIAVYGPGGAADVQAGGHPESLVSSIALNSLLHPSEDQPFAARYQAMVEPKTEVVNLPLGVVGDALAAPTCSETRVHGVGELAVGEAEPACPFDSKVGAVQIEGGGEVQPKPILNVAPEAGYPAEFGFEIAGTIVLLRARVLPSPSGYVLSVAVPSIPRAEALRVTGITLMFYGDPAQVDGTGATRAAMFTNPTDCTSGPLYASLEMNSWVDPAHWVQGDATMYEASPTKALTGCDLLQFNPQLSLNPERTQADEPSGQEVHLSVPQTGNVAPVLATPDLRDATLTLPPGVAASPAVASGLLACQERGPEGIELGSGDTSAHEAGEGEEITADGLPSVSPGHCPNASRLGDVEVSTPVLPQPLRGHLFLAQPLCGGPGAAPCSEADVARGQLAPVYLEVAGSGVVVKLKGQVSVSPVNGQLTAGFDENPQFPFDSLKISLYGGSRAPLANPQTCGPATVFAQLLPWSAPESGAVASPFATVSVTGCSAGGFSPSFLAQTTSALAGSYSPFQLTLTRKDGEPNLSSVSVSMPPGLLGSLANVTQCPEPAASQGSCAANSLIGHVQVAAGSGSTPFWTSGNVFLTGPYRGAPFGLSIVVPTVAGPFRLAGNNGAGSEVVRAAIHVNPTTAAISVSSDPIPQIVDGVQLRLKAMNISIDREGFIFNPTDCAQQQLSANVGSQLEGGAAGPSATVTSPFAVTGCKNLPFQPQFTASTDGQTSKANGASLKVKIGSPGIGQASLAKVDLTIPSILPSRLTTLQKACTEAQFNANPAGCPAASNIATATVHTPLLNSPLTGPVYFVSHGGAAFPDTEMVLQGEGVTLILDGHTQITKGVTYSRFESVPDAPFTSFEFNAPEGPYSIFAANGNLCQNEVRMLTKLVAQNGAVINQSTLVEPEGCPNKIAVVSHKVKKRTLTIGVAVPSAGKLTVAGKGLSKASKTAKGRGVLTLTLKAKGQHRINARVKLSFVPSKGKKLTSSIGARFGT
jgi:hypothetical protein